MATISAWAVGSFEEVTSLQPRPTMRPLRTTTAPNGPPLPRRISSIDSRIASRMNCCFMRCRESETSAGGTGGASEEEPQAVHDDDHGTAFVADHTDRERDRAEHGERDEHDDGAERDDEVLADD